MSYEHTPFVGGKYKNRPWDTVSREDVLRGNEKVYLRGRGGNSLYEDQNGNVYFWSGEDVQVGARRGLMSAYFIYARGRGY